jgi:hypothetical protein
MVIASENRAMATEYHRVAGTCGSPESPEQRLVPPGRISQGMVGCHELGQGARRLQEARSLRRYQIPVSPSCRGNPPGMTTRSLAQDTNMAMRPKHPETPALG